VVLCVFRCRGSVSGLDDEMVDAEEQGEGQRHAAHQPSSSDEDKEEDGVLGQGGLESSSEGGDADANLKSEHSFEHYVSCCNLFYREECKRERIVIR